MAFGYDLEEGLSIEVDVIELLVGLVVDVGIGKAEYCRYNPLEMMSPFLFEWLVYSLLMQIPWIRMMSPHRIMPSYSDIRYRFNNIK